MTRDNLNFCLKLVDAIRGVILAELTELPKPTRTRSIPETTPERQTRLDAILARQGRAA